MAAPRTPASGPPHRDQVAWPKGAAPHGSAPHGYDDCEFAPEQCTRDFVRPRRPHEADEERRQLRMADEAIGKRTKEDMNAYADAKWDEDDDVSVDGASRLYKD
ncbi:hypothetical protein GCM10007301_02540 [Azorhizobium oxalatiphilum]|uniref:Uncharacterized protein n=1 Tax=Azorhizobium oxalatiphilum TaxID=980631 RepID=A0A917BI82_9HYPH|nr:hypothetical protein [Azorhizobium oxalatiphilum]GGF46520.1 hypothetical protein GCM10007301_02540 [Azorhizobium oxalatiphilum]